MSRSRSNRDRHQRTPPGAPRGDYAGVVISTGTYATNEPYILIKPKGYVSGAKMGIVFCHGFGATEAQGMQGAFSTINLALARAGFPVMSIYAAGDSWGNDASITAVGTAVSLFKSSLGAKNAAIGLMGASMGGFTCLDWARANLAGTACYVGIIPGSDLNFLHSGNVGGSTASINAAYGGLYVSGTHGATHDPTVFASSGLTGLKAKMWYGDTDTIATPSTVTTLAGLIGGTASTVSVSGNHGTAPNNVPPADVVSYFTANQS